MTDGNGAAFPVPPGVCGTNHFGLSKRELLAAMAMQGMLADSQHWDLPPEQIALCAADQADKLLAALYPQNSACTGGCTILHGQEGK